MNARGKKRMTDIDGYAMKYALLLNNTPQAYPVVRYCDAQTGGLLFFGVCHAL